jgi:hypothetical protein
MVNELIQKVKEVILSSQSTSDKIDAIVSIDGLAFIIFVGLILTSIFNIIIFYLTKNIDKFSIKNKPDLNKVKIKGSEIFWVFCFYTGLTFLSYSKILSKITTHIFAIGGDSFNHYSRLVESKNILQNPDISIFHWPGIFFPDGLTAFDGAPTLYNDLIYYALENIFSGPTVYNLIHMSTFILAGIFCYMLILELTKRRDTALFTSFIYTFSASHYFASQLWLNITHIELIPIIFWLYIKLNQNNRYKYLVALSIGLTTLGYQSLYYFFITLFMLVIFFLLPKAKNIKILTINLIPIILSSIGLSFWLIPMLQDPTVEKSKYMPHIFYNTDFFKVIIGSNNIIFNNFLENPPFIGLPLLLLSLFSFFKKLNSRSINMAFIVLFILSVGSLLRINGNLYPMLSPEVLLTFIPGYKSLRATDRYITFLIIPIGVMSINSIIYLVKNKYAKYPIIILICCLQFNFLNNTIDVKSPEIYSKIPEPPSDRFGILELPINSQAYWMWRAEHKYEIVYGYLFIRGRKNKLFNSIHTKILKNEPIDINILKSKGVKYIISNEGWTENLYGSSFGYPGRLNKTYSGVSDYIDQKDLLKLKLITKDKNTYLYEIQ